MKKRWVILNAVLLALFAGVPTFSQNVPSAAKSEWLRHQFAMSLLRTINTAEAIDHTKYGSYSTWQTLLQHYPESFEQFLQQQLPNTHFADLPEILPGWNLRINMHADGQGYDVLLRDMTDEKCGYAAVTDESVVIRQSKMFPCEI